MTKKNLLSALIAAAFSTVTFSAIAADHAVPAKPDDATINANSSEARPGMVKPKEDQSKAKKAKKDKKHHKKTNKAEPKADETPAGK